MYIFVKNDDHLCWLRWMMDVAGVGESCAGLQTADQRGPQCVCVEGGRGGVGGHAGTAPYCQGAQTTCSPGHRLPHTLPPRSDEGRGSPLVHHGALPGHHETRHSNCRPRLRHPAGLGWVGFKFDIANFFYAKPLISKSLFR